MVDGFMMESYGQSKAVLYSVTFLLPLYDGNADFCILYIQWQPHILYIQWQPHIFPTLGNYL